MIKAWLNQHRLILLHTLKRMVSAPITNLLSILVMGIALSLPAGVYILMENLQVISGQSTALPQMSLFLKKDTQQQGFDLIRQRLEDNEQVIRYQFISKDQALYQLQQKNDGLNNVMRSLVRNPLPDAFIVYARDTSIDALESLKGAMQEWPEIEFVQFDSVWAKRLDAILNVGRVMVLMLFTLFSVAIVAVMFNTIRLQILTRREEIEVSKLIGATDSFIQRPFLYFGALQGLAGGFAAWSIVALALQALNEALSELAGLYALDLNLQHLSRGDAISLLLFTTWLGWLGARVSVASHLWQIKPT